MSASAILQVSYCKLDQINRQLTLLCATAETCALEIPNYCVKYNLKCWVNFCQTLIACLRSLHTWQSYYWL